MQSFQHYNNALVARRHALHASSPSPHLPAMQRYATVNRDCGPNHGSADFWVYRLQCLYLLAQEFLVDNAPEISGSATWTKLTISGMSVLAAFGGDTTLFAMTTVHIFAGRRWLGWCNQPGTHDIARRYGQLARSRICKILYGTHESTTDPAVLCGLKGTEPGPSYLAFPSGTSGNGRKTGNIAWLFLDECAAIPPTNHSSSSASSVMGGVTVVDLDHEPDASQTVQLPQGTYMLAMAAIPIVFSLLACVVCALLGDWYCASMILLGVVASGVSSCVIGSGPLTFAYTKSATLPPSPRRAGILHNAANMVVMKGPRGALDAITTGRLFLDYGRRPTYRGIGVCSVLFSLQLFVQLFVVPQGTLYGQLLFLATLVVSWVYNRHLASLDVDAILRRALFEQVLRVGPSAIPAQLAEKSHTQLGTARLLPGVDKYKLDNLTQQAVFALLVLAESEYLPLGLDTAFLKLLLDNLLPFRTGAWDLWKGEVLRNIEKNAECLRDEARRGGFRFEFPAMPVEGGLSWGLVEGLYEDAHAAAKVYATYRR
ncbi:hypothetical protein TRAPUB_11097 [Trametes pubescens]|uniref:Uncharacterized protein n=1 Tax=Trametes pubescens TaxID=154538 RepID=A0A1M2VXS8_TRAPU|nr:hypothetical protein TRAPUB_11097 [Trametes pubescens]